MAIQAKLKSKGDRTSQARRATNDELERTAVTPALLPENAARSQQFKPAELEAADPALATESDDQTVSVRMCKIGDETHVTLIGDLKIFMRDFGTKDPDFLQWPCPSSGECKPEGKQLSRGHWSRLRGEPGNLLTSWESRKCLRSSKGASPGIRLKRRSLAKWLRPMRRL